MSIIMTLRIALKALNRNKMRTVLTMLGMIIGVGAVITMVALGRGAQATIEEQVKSAGTNVININAGNFTQGGVRQGQGQSSSLHADDATALRAVPGVQYVSAGVNSRGQIIAGNQNWSSQIQGVDVDFQAIRSWPTKYGSFFTPQDVSSAAKVALLGTVVAEMIVGAAPRRSLLGLPFSGGGTGSSPVPPIEEKPQPLFQGGGHGRPLEDT